LKTKNEFVSGIKLIPMLGNMATTAVESHNVKNKIDINNLPGYYLGTSKTLH
jgi:hypothetical protein